MVKRGKQPPTFPHVHPSRAKKFKKAWVEKAKITSKWKAQKKKERLTEKAKLEIPNYDFESRDDSDEPTLHASDDLPQNDTSNVKAADRPDQDHIRELTRKAYSKTNLHTFKSDPLKKHLASGKLKGETGKGQPNMKLRMGALLAKIQREYA